MVCAGIRDQGCNIGNKPLIWKHLTDWHFILQQTITMDNVICKVSLPPFVLAVVVYTVVRYKIC